MSEVRALRMGRSIELRNSLIAMFFHLFRAAGSAPVAPGTLALTVVDEVSNRTAPAHVEPLDQEGIGYFAEDALPIDGDCVDRVVPADLTLERAIAVMSKKIENPYTKTLQFYSVGNSLIPLPPGDYKLKVRNGLEYQIQERDVHFTSDETIRFIVRMTRWIELPEQGVYSGDDHLHIARPIRELNPFISKWIEAEDVHIGNLLQFCEIV